MQYSYLPSWMSFLVDQVKARDAGRALFDAVYGAWAQLPPESAPEALRLRREPGHLRRGGRLQRARRHHEPYGRRAVGRAAQLQRAVARASSTTATPARRSGCPSSTTAAPSGSPTRPPTSTSPPAPWGEPRVAYLQNASDPIVWWSPQLILSHPDWLRGERGPRRLPEHGVAAVRHVLAGHRRPGVRRPDVPDGHGHKYEADYVNGWADVAQPPGWTAADTARLRPHDRRGDAVAGRCPR